MNCAVSHKLYVVLRRFLQKLPDSYAATIHLDLTASKVGLISDCRDEAREPEKDASVRKSGKVWVHLFCTLSKVSTPTVIKYRQKTVVLNDVTDT